MKPGDVILTRKLRAYTGMKIAMPGVAKYANISSHPGEYIVLLYLGAVPKGADPLARERIQELGFVPREGYPNPNRFSLHEFRAACITAANDVAKQAPPCAHCEEGRPEVVADDLGGAKIKCSGCDSTVELELCEEFPNSIQFAMHAMQAWMASIAIKQDEETPTT